MAILDNKIQTVANGCSGIRQALKEFDSSLGAGNISTLGDDVRSISRSTLVIMQNPDRMVNVLNNGKTTNVISSNSNVSINDVIEVVVPNGITTIAANTFKDCVNLTGDLILPDSVTSIGDSAFSGCSALNSLTSPVGGKVTAFENCVQNGTLTINGDLTSVGYKYIHAKNVVINGNMTKNDSVVGSFDIQKVETLRIKGNFTISAGILFSNTASQFKFLEITGTISRSNGALFYNTTSSNNVIVHLSQNSVPPIQTFGINNAHGGIINSLSKIYVGDGSSQSADQAVLNKYLANSDWSQYSSKLDLWYNYTGEYKE